jgi:hypothetical protein
MKALGYALVISALVGGAIFVMNLLSSMAGDQCARNCPNDPQALVEKLDIGPFHYVECMCK